jgi:proline-specific peptidase
MAAPVHSIEGRIPFNVNGERFETYYKLSGDLASSKTPVIVLHGGPGTAHNYMAPLFDLAQGPDPVPVILYDQLGTGLSSRPVDQPASFWTIDLFIDELVNVLAHFSITDSFNIVGHSWGATLAAEFVVRRQPAGLKHLVLANSLASAKLRNASIARRRASLPSDVQDTLRRHEEAGTVQDPEYKTAMMVFHEAFTCKAHPLPQELFHAFDQVEANGYLVSAM